MNKSPDEIKKGLEYLSTKDIVKKMDLWKEGIAYDYAEDAAADALNYIKLLEEEKEALMGENRICLQCKYMELTSTYADCDSGCDYCAHEKCHCKGCVDHSNWQWRGVQKEEGNGEA